MNVFDGTYVLFFFSHWSHEDMWGRILHGGIITGIWLMKEFNICEISYIFHQKLYQRLYENQPKVLKLQNHGLVEVCYFILRCFDWILWHNNYIWVVVTFVTIIIIYWTFILTVFVFWDYPRRKVGMFACTVLKTKLSRKTLLFEEYLISVLTFQVGRHIL